MKKFYDKHLRVNDDELISNSTFVANIVFSMFVMVICVAMMSMSAFAYFSYSLSSSHNTIVSASYSLSVVNKQGVPEERDEPGVFILDNSSNSIDAVYSFEVKKMGTASVGFAQVIVINGDGEKIFDEYTSPIGDDVAEARYFDVTVPYGTFYTVKVIAHWGTCSTSAGDFDEIVVEITRKEYDKRFDTIEVILEESDEVLDENLDEELLEGEEGTEGDELVDDELTGDDSLDTGSDEVLDDEGSNDESMDNNQEDSDKDDTVLDDETGSDDEILDDGTDEELNNSDDQQTDEGSNDEQLNDEVEDNQEQEDPVDNTIEQQDVENTEENSGDQEL